MRLSKLAAGAGAAALVGVMTIAAAAPAYAADEYITTDDIGVEGAEYPAGWFTGELSDPSEAGTLASTANGLEVTGKVQLLNGTVPDQNITALADNLFTESANNDWTMQIALFGDGAAEIGFTTLRPVGEGYQNSAADWITTGAIAGPTPVDPPAYTAGATASLQDFEDAFDAQIGATHEILAYGYFFDNGSVDALHASEYNGDVSYFTPAPVVVVTPNPVSIADFTTAGKGITITSGGFIPGDEVFAFIEVLDAGEGTELDGVIADENGVATFTYVAPAGSVLGDYTVYVGNGYNEASVALSVVANAALAATGVDVTPALLAGGSLLALGAVLLILRRRTAVQ